MFLILFEDEKTHKLTSDFMQGVTSFRHSLDLGLLPLIYFENYNLISSTTPPNATPKSMGYCWRRWTRTTDPPELNQRCSNQLSYPPCLILNPFILAYLLATSSFYTTGSRVLNTTSPLSGGQGIFSRVQVISLNAKCSSSIACRSFIFFCELYEVFISTLIEIGQRVLHKLQPVITFSD